MITNWKEEEKVFDEPLEKGSNSESAKYLLQISNLLKEHLN